MPVRILTPDTLGAWLLKATGAGPSTQAHVRAGSNPSYVTPRQLEVLVGLREELGRSDA